MIYTVGFIENYLKSYAQHKAEGMPLKKVGKLLPGVDPQHPDGYRGGSVWQTYEDAYEYLIATQKTKTFAVFGVDADWATDTENDEGRGYNNLLRDADIILLPDMD